MADRYQTAGWITAEFISKQVHPGKAVFLSFLSFFFFSYLLSKADSAALVDSSLPLTGWCFLGSCAGTQIRTEWEPTQPDPSWKARIL